MPAYFAMLFDDDFLEISNMTECLEDGDDLIGALFVFASKTGGEGFGGLADGGQEFADGGDLGGEIGRPIEDDNGGGGVRGVFVFGEADFRMFGRGSAGGLEIRAEPTDVAALFHGFSGLKQIVRAGAGLQYCIHDESPK